LLRPRDELVAEGQHETMRTLASYPFHFHIALDGNGINGLEGLAGVCLFAFDLTDNSYAYKISYLDGVAAGHAVSVNPRGDIGFLGNAGQHLVFYDAWSLDELTRQSTLAYETPLTSLQGSTHLVWLDDDVFVTAIGDHFYQGHVQRLGDLKRLLAHQVKLPHAMKLTASKRYVVYGSMDSPAYGAQGEARQIGIWDRENDSVRVVQLPATCWHVLTHPREELAYAVSFRVAPQDYRDYHEWGMAFLKNYVFEIDLREGRVVRHWSAGREVPAHINSDITISDSELIFCNGGSQNILALDLKSFAHWRSIDERPGLDAHVTRPREVATQVVDALARGTYATNSRHFLGALRVSRFSLLDSIYACQLSADQKLLFTANRGLNHITVYNYPDASICLRAPMPPLQEFQSWMPTVADPRLGFHHSILIERTP
jgi:hypothetical protein